MTGEIFDKTNKGREEISTRKYGLAPRLRPLLVMIDGRQSAADILKKVTGLGLNEESIAELLDNGFIQGTSGLAVTGTFALAETSIAGKSPDTPGQFEAIYRFYTETIKSTIGLRGYALQLKVEKAGTVDDFRALRQSYVDAVFKARGNEMARSLGMRLDQLLFGENQPPDITAQQNVLAGE